MKKKITIFTITFFSLTVYSQSYHSTRDTFHIPSNSICGFFEEPTGVYFYWLNPSFITDGIHFYKETKGEFSPYKNIKFSTEILDAFRNRSISLASFVFISFDTALSINGKEIVMLDLKKGKILQRTTYNTDSNYSLLLSDNPQNMWNPQRRSLAFRLYYIGDYVNKREQYYTGQLVAEVFPETGVVNKFPMKYPVMNIFKYSGIASNLFYPNITFHGDTYVVGFLIIPLTYEYNVTSNKLETKNVCEEGYIPLPEYKNPTLASNDYEDPNIASWIFSHTRIYNRLIYDAYTHRYYRFFSQQINDNDKTSVQGVSVFDNQWQMIGKNIIFDSPVSVYYPTSKGIYGYTSDVGFGIIINKLEIIEK
ncbi:MAG: DUF4221 family protein [Bacteroidales bacterium]|nr:DUF4221 family protein [Bacteroidales bacterium]MDD4208767.1 DUF4221 family protein [Bacteroidales bacterium]